MATATAVLFPGQGVNPVEAVRVLSEHADAPLVRHVLDVTGLSRVEPADLADTRVAQPVIVATGLLATAAAGVTASSVAAAVGHSLGEITALAFAGAITPAAAVELVALRAELGHRVQQQRTGLMVAALKIDLGTVESVRERAVAEVGGVLELAVVNGPRQHVLSGDRATAARAADLIAEAGGVPRRLGIGGPFHSSLLSGVVGEMTDAAARALTGSPTIPVVMSTAPIVATGTQGLAEHLGVALVRPVDWPRTLRLARDELGIARGVDAGPGATLATMAEHDPVISVSALGG